MEQWIWEEELAEMELAEISHPPYVDLALDAYNVADGLYMGPYNVADGLYSEEMHKRAHEIQLDLQHLIGSPEEPQFLDQVWNGIASNNHGSWEAANSGSLEDILHQDQNPTNPSVALPQTEIKMTKGNSMSSGCAEQESLLADNPAPNTYRHSKEALSILRIWFNSHSTYPSQREMCKLSMETLLTSKQVSHWFKNERERSWRKDPNNAAAKRKNNRLPEFAINVLKEWVNNHLENPKPTVMEKDLLAEETRLTKLQVSYWFENYQQRKRKRKLQKVNLQETMEAFCNGES